MCCPRPIVRVKGLAETTHEAFSASWREKRAAQGILICKCFYINIISKSFKILFS